ncbi:MAG: hypothetical protein ACI8QC_003677 [Planctomycetota bacterium]|jgi:hypothetical protein
MALRVGGGLLCVFILASQLVVPTWRGYAGEDWLEVPCGVFESRWEVLQRNHAARTHSTWTACACRYEGRRIAFFGALANNPTATRSLVSKRYPVGKQAVGFVNPGSSNNAVLIPGALSSSPAVAIALLFLNVAVFELLLSFGVSSDVLMGKHSKSSDPGKLQRLALPPREEGIPRQFLSSGLIVLGECSSPADLHSDRNLREAPHPSPYPPSHDEAHRLVLPPQGLN